MAIPLAKGDLAWFLNGTGQRRCVPDKSVQGPHYMHARLAPQTPSRAFYADGTRSS